MLGLIKLLAVTATAMILNHQANAHHCHSSIDYRCEGTIFQLVREGDGDNLVGKFMNQCICQPFAIDFFSGPK